MEKMKINKLEIENVKRVRAVTLEPTKDGLTIIGGNNNQGKTSVLDAIAWAIGGNKFRPSEATRKGSVIPPNIKITMNNGLIVERKGKNSDLKVTDPNGQKHGQALLDSFVEELALDLPKFMESTNKEKALTLLNIIGVGPQLSELEEEEKRLFNERYAIGRIADQKEKFAREQVHYPDVPNELISPGALIAQQQEILARNGKNQEMRKDLQDLVEGRKRKEEEYRFLVQKIEDLENQLIKLKNEKGMASSMLKEYDINIENCQKTVNQLQDESTEELERNLANIEEINIKVRANFDKEKAEEDAKQYRNEYKEFTAQLEKVRQDKIDLLKNANLPLDGLSVEDGELTYKGFKWDNISGANRLKIATAIVRMLKPQCGFVLMDKLEQMDLATLTDFGQWLRDEGLQVIATRVSTGDECSVIIEDGYAVEMKENKRWEAGKF